MNRHDTMKVFIEDGVLTMQVGVEMIAFAALHHPETMGYDDKTGEWMPPVINDADKFAVEVMKQVNTDHDGEPTMVEAMLDAAIINAIEAGAEGITLHGDTPVSRPIEGDSL